MTLQVVKTEKELKLQAKEAESADPARAASLYKQIIKQDPLDKQAYDRLMVIYRKQKQWEDELAIINRGIKNFEDVQRKKISKLNSKHKELARLSNALIKKAGIKKINEEYSPEPVYTWKKRRAIVEKKLGKS